MHVRPLLCQSSTVLFDRSNVSVNVRPYADCAGSSTKCGFSHMCVCVCVDGCYRLTPKSVFLASVNDRAGSSDSHSSRVSVSPSTSCLRARVDWQSSQCSRVCASSSHDGQLGLTLGSIRLAYALRCLECPARNWASKVASALDFT